MNININNFPDEIIHNIARLTPLVNQLELERVNQHYYEAMNSPEFNFALAHTAGFETCLRPSDTNHILVPNERRVYALTKDYFFRNASLFEKFKYYSGYNELSMMRSYCIRKLANPNINVLKESKKIISQKYDVTLSLNDLPWYSRIPFSIIRSLYINERTQDFAAAMHTEDNYNEDLEDFTPGERAGYLFWQRNPIGTLISPFYTMTQGVQVSNLTLTQFSSLKGRAICLINAAFYAVTTVLSIPFTATMTAVSILATLIFTPIAAVSAFIVCIIYWDRRGSSLTLFPAFLALFVGYNTFSNPIYHAATLCRTIAGAILDPCIFLTVETSTYGTPRRTFPNILFGV